MQQPEEPRADRLLLGGSGSRAQKVDAYRHPILGRYSSPKEDTFSIWQISPLLLLSTNASAWESFGKFLLFALSFAFVCLSVYVFRWALRTYHKNSDLNSELYKIRTDNIILSSTLDSEKRAAIAQGRLEGLLVNMQEVGKLYRYKSESEALKFEAQMLRTNSKALLEERETYRKRYGEAVDRINAITNRINDQHFENTDLRKQLREVEKEPKKLGQRWVQDGSKLSPSWDQDESKLGSGWVKDGFKLSPESENLNLTPGKAENAKILQIENAWNKIEIVQGGKVKNFYLDKILDASGKWTWEIGLFHVNRTEPLTLFHASKLEKGEVYEITDKFNALLCESPTCNNLKLGDRRAKVQEAKYCSKTCRKSHAKISANIS